MNKEPEDKSQFRVDAQNPKKILSVIRTNYLLAREKVENVLLDEETNNTLPKRIILGTVNFNGGLFSRIATYASVIPISCHVNFTLAARYHNPQKDGYWPAEQSEYVKKGLSDIYGNNKVEELSMVGLEEFKIHTLCIQDDITDSVFSVSLGFETSQDQTNAYMAYLASDIEQLGKDDDIMTEEMGQIVVNVFNYLTPLRSSPLPEILARTYTPIPIPLTPRVILNMHRIEGTALSKSYVKNLREECREEEQTFLSEIQQWGNFIKNLINVLSQTKHLTQKGNLVLSAKP